MAKLQKADGNTLNTGRFSVTIQDGFLFLTGQKTSDTELERDPEIVTIQLDPEEGEALKEFLDDNIIVYIKEPVRSDHSCPQCGHSRIKMIRTFPHPATVYWCPDCSYED